MVRFRRLLAIYAHPDDEAFGAAGTFATFTDLGGEVTLVCATRGEVGEISDPALAMPETLGSVREVELRGAMAHVGVSDIRFLGYRDSGMAGTAENQAPDNFINASDEEVVETLVTIMREVEPDIVLTFGPDGIYGHPDHIKAYRTATQATVRYAESSGGDGPALYYNAVPRERIQTMAQQRESGPFVNMTPAQIAQLGTPEELITTVLDVSSQFERKMAAIFAHRTQIGPDGPWSDLPADQVRSFLSTERFRLTQQPWSRAGEDPLLEMAAAAKPIR